MLKLQDDYTTLIAIFEDIIYSFIQLLMTYTNNLSLLLFC